MGEPDDEAERVILARLLTLLHEGGGGYRISFMLTDLLRLLGWPTSESSWGAVRRALDRYMQPVRREFSVVPPADSRGRPGRVTSWRRLVSGYEYSEESEHDTAGPRLNLAACRVTVTFNPDILPGPEAIDGRRKSRSGGSVPRIRPLRGGRSRPAGEGGDT